MIEEKAVEILGKLEVLAKQFAPEVMDAAVGVVQVSGISRIAVGFILLSLAFATYKISTWLYEFFKKKKEDDGYLSDWEIGYTTVAVVGSMAFCVLVVIGALQIFDIWSWVAIFNPKLALAKQIMGF